MADASDPFSAIRDSPVVLVLFELGGALPSHQMCPICADCGPLPAIFRPELFVRVVS